MKTKIILLLLLCSLTSFSQTIEKLKVATKKIYDANYTMDFDTIVNLTYPKIVETLGGKNAMLNKLDSDYQNDEFRMRLELVTPVFQYSEIKKIEGKTFCVITYRNPIRYFFENKLDNDTAVKKVNWLKENNSTKEVFFEPKRNSINVKRISKLVAIADETTSKDWKFFNFDDSSQREIFKALFSENTKKELGF
ncbi:hypothetical protein [Flavobacterium myungsuense]|uniref:DUF4468 domain-containing protein n=1 Tax=Flavobacterium myungsuense TaxID=651823 RepID=A0ABW3IY15_9FLAO